MERYGHGANLSSEQGAHLAVLCHDKLNGPVILSAAFGKTFGKGFIPSLSCNPWTNTTSKKKSQDVCFVSEIHLLCTDINSSKYTIGEKTLLKYILF